MAHDNCRILLHITMLPRENPVETQKVDTIYCRVNDSLDGTAQLPNVSNLCQSYDKMNSKLAAYIRNSCFDMEKDDIVFRTKRNLKVCSLILRVLNEKKFAYCYIQVCVEKSKI